MTTPVPCLVDSFAELPPTLAATLRARGFTALTPVQRAVLDSTAEGRDLRISSQTGSGKTVALGMALFRDLSRGGRSKAAGPLALVIVPTRELAAQVQAELEWLYAEARTLRSELATGGTSVLREQRQLARQPALVVGTPGRLLDHLRSGVLDPTQLRHVVLDEADRMLDMGFREELEAILDALPASRRTHLVSATFPPSLLRLADRFQANPLHLAGTPLGVANASIDHVAHSVHPYDAYAALVNLLLLEHGQRCLVFVKRRVDASALAEKLAADGFSALPFSGELPQAERTRTLQAFRAGRVHVLISTDVAARGIDVPGIATVIHADLPSDVETYVHRSGRTGRAGERGRSLLLVPAPAVGRVRRLLQAARIRADWRAIPDPDAIRRALEQRREAELARTLDALAAPSERQREQAAKLLRDRDPIDVVARMLAQLGPTPPCEPRALRVDEVPRLVPARAAKARSSGDFVRFCVSWGTESEATPSRVLSHVCRRGQIQSRHVGAIRVERARSHFEIAREVATQFEAKARKRDAREPWLVIRRADSTERGRSPSTRPRAHGGPARA